MADRLVGADVEDFAVVVRDEAAHAVMDLGLEFADVPRTFDERDLVVVDVAAPDRVGLGLHDLVEFLDLCLEGVGLDAGGLGEGFERVVLLDDLAFEHFFKEARALLLERLHVGFVADGEALLAVGLFDHDGVGADLAVGELVDEALAFGVDPEAVFGGGRLVELPADAHALFTRATPRATLDPVVLDLEGADGGRFTPHFGRGTRLVRRIERFVELRILEHAELHVGGEAAVAEHHALRRADRLHLARVGLREAVAFADLNALDAVVTADDVFDEHAVAQRNAEFLALVEFLRNDARTRAVRRRDVARNGVTAFLADGVGQVLHAEFLDGPFIIGERMLGQIADLARVVHVVAGRENVLLKQLDRVLDLVELLLRAARGGQNAAVDDRVAAERGHFFKNDDVRARLLRLNGGGKTGKTRADDDHVDDFVPLLLRRGDGDGGACKSRTGGDCTLDEMTAGKIGHGKFLLKLTPDEPTSPEAASGDSALRPDGTRASTGRTLSPFVIILLSTGAMRERTNPHPNHLPLNSRSGLYVTTTVLDRTWKDDAAGVLTPQRPFPHGNRRYTLK